MAFPTSPTNGQTTTVNGITYVYNSTNNAWKRQTLTDLSVTGNVTAGNFFYSNGVGVLGQVYDLDEIYPDGRTNTFYLKYNQSNVNIPNPWNILVNINGFMQPAFMENTDTVWFSHALCAQIGYTVSSGNIKFADAPPAGTTIRIRTQTGSSIDSRIYPFRPLDISLGI